jgi:hypothetical protein
VFYAVLARKDLESVYSLKQPFAVYHCVAVCMYRQIAVGKNSVLRWSCMVSWISPFVVRNVRDLANHAQNMLVSIILDMDVPALPGVHVNFESFA